MDVYDAIYQRRDVRHFRTEPVADSVLLRILRAAHHAGSVGFMQPWNFIIVRTPELKERVYESFAVENARASENYEGDRRALYDSFKLAGILEAPVNIAVTCDRSRRGPAVLGRGTMPETDLFSTCCAIQNLWLAARAEEIGVGWVSILDPDTVKKVLKIPPEIALVAYLCVGYPVHFDDRPMLERAGWESRTPLEEMIFADSWNHKWIDRVPE
jgi:5,6-dimethylbenzimidazole synthase